MALALIAAVTDSGGRTVAVYPETQIVWAMSAWVTRGSVAPGVSRGSGRTTPRGAVAGGVALDGVADWAAEVADAPADGEATAVTVVPVGPVVATAAVERSEDEHEQTRRPTTTSAAGAPTTALDRPARMCSCNLVRRSAHPAAPLEPD